MGMLLFPILACSQPIIRNDATSLTIGVLNEFPDTAQYIKKRTFVFRHQIAAYEEDRFKKFLTHSAEGYLISKGYKVIEVKDKTALTDGRADMIVQILPMIIFKQDGTLGYGFYDRKLLVVVLKQPAKSFICLNMKLYRKDRGKVVSTKRQEGFSNLMIKELPDSPDQLSENEIKEMSLNLERNIKKTIIRSLSVLGL
jgi:hypothetical protein